MDTMFMIEVCLPVSHLPRCEWERFQSGKWEPLTGYATTQDVALMLQQRLEYGGLACRVLEVGA